MEVKHEKIDDNIINSILQSNDIREIIKKLVQGEVQNSGNQESAIQKLSELFSHSNLNNESNTKMRPSKHSSIIPINDMRAEKPNYSEDEVSRRCSLASLFRLIDMEGWAKSIYNLITLRIPSKNNFNINPFGLLYHEITASSILEISSDGTIIDNGCTILGINRNSWALHDAIYKARADVHCIVQLSLPDVVAISSIKSGLLPVSIEAIKLLDISPNSLSPGGVKYHEILHYNPQNEFQKLISDLGNSKILFLRNNGLLVCGSSIAEVWVLTKTVVTACKAQIRLIQLGGRDLLHSECNFTKTNTLFSDINWELNHSGYKTDASLDSELEFEAMMRLLDKAGYRTGHKYTHKQYSVEKSVFVNGNKENNPESDTLINYDSMVDETRDEIDLGHSENTIQIYPMSFQEEKCEDGFVPDENTIQVCPVPPHEEQCEDSFVPNENTIQVCPMPPYEEKCEDGLIDENTVQDGEDPCENDVDDDNSLRERELVKEICTEIIDNSIKFCEAEEAKKQNNNEHIESVDNSVGLNNKNQTQIESEDTNTIADKLDCEKSFSYTEKLDVKQKSATISGFRSKSFGIGDKHSKNKTLEFNSDSQNNTSNSKLKKRHTFRASNILKLFHKKL